MGFLQRQIDTLKRVSVGETTKLAKERFQNKLLIPANPPKSQVEVEIESRNQETRSSAGQVKRLSLHQRSLYARTGSIDYNQHQSVMLTGDSIAS